MGDYLTAGELSQVGQGAVAEHGAALLGRAGQHEDYFPVLFKGAAGGSAAVIVEHCAALGEHGLIEVIIGELAAVTDIVIKALVLTRISLKLKAEALRHDDFCKVVAGGAQTAGGDYYIGTLLGYVDAVFYAARVIPYHGMVKDVYADFREHFRHVPGIGIGHMAQKKLRAHGDYLGGVLSHAPTVILSIPARASSTRASTSMALSAASTSVI